MLKYMNLPHSVMKVVNSWNSLSKGTEWYPLIASKTVFFFEMALAVTTRTVNKYGVSPVCTMNVPSWFTIFLLVMTIRVHQSVGMPTGTGVMILFFTSSQRACFNHSLKWKGTGIGLCLALETGPSLRWMWVMGPDMDRNTPLFLNTVLAKCSQRQSLRLSMFSSIGGKGVFLGAT